MNLKDHEISRFSISLKVSGGESLASDSNFEVSKAHLEKFSKLYPDVPEVSREKLSRFASETAVINLVNENDDVILTEDALRLAPTFIYKPVNFEHSPCEILGFITSYGFSSFSDSSPIEESTLGSDKQDPFYMTFGGILWKSMYSLAEDLEKSDWLQEVFSTSWEVRFNKFYVAIGSKRISDAEIVKDEEEIGKIKQYLRRYGGKGFLPDGRPVYRVLTGDLYGDGIGVTSNPAADVKGISLEGKSSSVNETNEIVMTSTASKEPIEKQGKEEEIQEKVQEKVKKNSIVKKQIVYKNSMKNFEALIKTSEGGEVSFASVTDLREAFNEAVKTAASEYVKEAEEQATAKKQLEEELDKSKKAAEDLENKFLKLSAKLEEVERAQASREAEETFKERFQKVSSAFELKEEALPIIEKRVRACQDDAAFASLMSEFDIMLSKKVEQTKENAGGVFDKSTASKDQATPPNVDGGGEGSVKKFVVEEREKDGKTQLYI